MFKSHNTRLIYLFLCTLFIGTCSSVFAVDFSQAVDQMKEDVSGMWNLFQGKVVVANIYSKALKLVKNLEVTSTTTSFEQLRAYYSDCSNLQDSDFINVLYNSNFSFRQTFDQILPQWTTSPSKKKIDISYAKFFKCKNIFGSGTAQQVDALNKEVNRIYYQWYTNAYSLSTLNQDNFWSDSFWNGTLDDSSFDLLYDINQVGKILFENFKESPEVLFYTLPQIKSSSTQNGDDLSSLSDQGSFQVWGGGWSFPGTSWVPSWASSSVWWSQSSDGASFIDASASSSQRVSNGDLSPLVADKEVKTFIEATNPNSSLASSASSAVLLWNQCLTPDTPAPIVEEQPLVEDAASYISGLVHFINNPNIEDIINTHLLAQFKFTNPLSPWWSSSDPGSADAIANAYAEQSFGSPAIGTCAYSCKDLPLDKQVKCEFDCAGSCIQKCDGLWIQDKVLCVSDCACFLVSWPQGEWREKVEDMYRIKFCKIPVQKKTLSPWKKVFSIQAIFQEISDVLEWLRDSGQMVAFSKTKEFLDGTIKIKFADNFAFKLQVWFKPLFPQKNLTTKLQEETESNAWIALGVLGMNTSAPEADDYNKYLIISNPIKNKANLEYATSLEEINRNIANFTSAASNSIQLSDQEIENIRKSYVQWTNISFMNTVIPFLQSNQLFRNDLSSALLNINKMSLELKTRIENSK